MAVERKVVEEDVCVKQERLFFVTTAMARGTRSVTPLTRAGARSHVSTTVSGIFRTIVQAKEREG